MSSFIKTKMTNWRIMNYFTGLEIVNISEDALIVAMTKI